MRIIFILQLTVICTFYSSAQMDAFVGKYVGTVQTDSAYGESIGHTVSMTINLTLNADSTYNLIWDLNFYGWCSFDSPWYNTGKWIVQKDFLFFTIDEYDYNDLGRRAYPNMGQERNTFTKKEQKMIFKFKQKHGEYRHYLKVENGQINGLHASFDCIEEVLKNQSIVKI